MAGRGEGAGRRVTHLGFTSSRVVDSYPDDAISAGNQGDPRRHELVRRIENAILPEGGSAHVEEMSDPYLLWFWNSNVRSTSIALDALVRRGALDLSRVRPIVRWRIWFRPCALWLAFGARVGLRRSQWSTTAFRSSPRVRISSPG